MTDEELYLVYMSGKEEAAAELVERYGDRLVLFICGYIHDEQEAEDLMTLPEYSRNPARYP